MLSKDLQTFAAPRIRIINVIWGAMLATPIIYLVVVYVAAMNGDWSTRPETGMAGDFEIVVPALALVSVIVAAVSFLWPRRAFSAVGLARAPRSFGPQAPVDLLDRMSETDRNVAGLLPYYQSTMIVVWAMREAIAVFGVVTAILRTEFVIAVPFAAVAVALLYLARPRPLVFLEGVRGRV